MKNSSKDFPSRSEYAAALRWWEVLSIAFNHTYRHPISLPESYGMVKRGLVGLLLKRRPSGKYNWGIDTFTLIWLTLMLAGLWLVGSTFQNWAMIWIWILFTLLMGLSILAWTINIAFRAGGWEQVLDEREKKMAWRKQQESLRKGYPNR